MQSTPPNHKIKVICRVRPFLPHESPDTSVQVEDNFIKVTNQRNPTEILKYNFASCYGPEAKQVDVFQQDVKPLIEHVFSGMDATIFAYGVTGSGKTHTMQGSDTEPGIIPRTMRLLFERRRRSKKKIDLKISYMEIYKENVFDLLISRDSQSTGLPIREDSSRNIFVANLTEKEIYSVEDFDKVYSAACKNRSVASTKLNEHSSRSHAILCIQVIIRDPDEGLTLSGRINLTDLAGSEDNRRTENGKERMAESGAINRSLFVLGQVVEALNLGLSRIPYRDSKMTRILQHSLGGKSLGMMIVNIAPGQSFYMDSYNTLNFATKSKEIENKPTVNKLDDSKPARNPLTSLGKPLRASADANTGTRKRLSDTVLDQRPAKRPTVHVEQSLSSDTGRRPLAPKAIKPVNRVLAQEKPRDWREMRKEKDERELEKKVAMIVEKQMKAKILSPLIKKHQTDVQSRLESLEQRLDVKTDSEIALMLTPETKTKTALAHVKLGKKAQKQSQFQGALDHYEKALLFMPENDRLQIKVEEVRDIMNGVHKPRRRDKQDKSADTSHDATTPRDAADTTFISSSGNGSFLLDNPSAVSISTSSKRRVSEQPPMTEEQRTRVIEELVRIVNTGVIKKIKGIKGIGAKRAEKIVDYVGKMGPIVNVEELVAAGLSETVVNTVIKSNRSLII